jgi:pimeloyl-ACP methyl ester carboxylesterase
MNRLVMVTLVPMLLLIAHPCRSAPDTHCEGVAARLLESIRSEDFQGATTTFADDLKARLPAAKLQDVMSNLKKQLGAMERVGEATSSTTDGTRVVTIPVYFHSGALDSRTACDANGRVIGFRFVPRSTRDGAAPSATYREPAYARKGAFSEIAVSVGPHKLPGRATAPNGKTAFPGVVFVHGSGPHDMDESIGPNKPFADLALGLASEGIASLRYEKRTHARPGLFSGDDYSVDDEVIDDAIAAVAELRKVRGIDPARVFVLGHSLGAKLAPHIAARADVRGIILLAAPATSLEDLLKRQVRYLAAADGTISAEEKAALEDLDTRLANLRDVVAGKPAAGPLPLGLPARYLKDLAARDAIATAATLRTPVMVLQGERDYQVTMPDDFLRWKQRFGGDARFRFKSYRELNHLFQPGTGRSTPAEYQVPGNMSDVVIKDIAAWIGEH